MIAREAPGSREEPSGHDEAPAGTAVEGFFSSRAIRISSTRIVPLSPVPCPL